MFSIPTVPKHGVSTTHVVTSLLSSKITLTIVVLKKNIAPPYTNYVLDDAKDSDSISGHILFGNGWSDNLNFQFFPAEDDGCRVFACSKSGGFSNYDSCATYCDTKNLIRSTPLTLISSKFAQCQWHPDSQANCPVLGTPAKPDDDYCNNRT